MPKQKRKKTPQPPQHQDVRPANTKRSRSRIRANATYKGSPKLLDYSATKGAIVGFTRSLSQSLVEKGIRVNAVAPGPIWTPLIPSTFPAKEVANFGVDVPMKRVGQPEKIATCFVFLASDDSSYLTGQVLHPNGGTTVNG